VDVKVKSSSFFYGFLGFVFLIALFVTIVTFIGGFQEVVDQLSEYGIYIVILALGFGIQVGLYSHIRNSGKAVAVTGSTSGLAMISCCSHYLVSFLPVLGLTGISGIVSIYQVEIFLAGILMNFIGILYLISKMKNE